MSTKVKLAQVWFAQNALAEANQLKKSAPLTFKLGLYTNEVIGPLLEQITKQKDELITELGTDGPDGNKQIAGDSPNMKEFAQRFNDLLETETEITTMDITFKDFITALGDDAKIDGGIFLIQPFFKAEGKKDNVKPLKAVKNRTNKGDKE